MIVRLVSFWNGLLSGAVLVSGSVHFVGFFPPPPAFTRYPDSSQVSRTAVLLACSRQLVWPWKKKETLEVKGHEKNRLPWKC